MFGLPTGRFIWPAHLLCVEACPDHPGNPAQSAHRWRATSTAQRTYGLTVSAQIKRELGRRPAVAPVIGHLKEDHRMGRNYLAGQVGDAANAVLAAVGYNFRLLLVWLAGLCWLICTFVRSADTSAPDTRCVT